jgi:hypothetical protein
MRYEIDFDALRTRLIEHMNEYPITMYEAARRMGLAYHTIRSVIHEPHKTPWRRTLAIIQKYLNDHDKQQGLKKDNSVT